MNYLVYSNVRFHEYPSIGSVVAPCGKTEKRTDNEATGVLISPQPDLTKKQLKGHHFSSVAEVIASAETWLDGKYSEFFFFEWLAKFSLVAVACFLPVRAKDLSAPMVIIVLRKFTEAHKNYFIYIYIYIERERERERERGEECFI